MEWREGERRVVSRARGGLTVEAATAAAACWKDSVGVCCSARFFIVEARVVWVLLKDVLAVLMRGGKNEKVTCARCAAMVSPAKSSCTLQAIAVARLFDDI